MKSLISIISGNIILCLLFTASVNSFAQKISPVATPASGGYFSAGGKSLSWTLGETFTSTLTSGTKKLTQGNQQPYIFLKLLNLKVFISGFYQGGGQMRPVLYTNNLNADPTACDSIQVELHDAISPFAIYTAMHVLLHTDGSAEARFPIAVLNNSYYIVIRHRNAMETWSKTPVRFKDAIASFDLTNPN